MSAAAAPSFGMRGWSLLPLSFAGLPARSAGSPEGSRLFRVILATFHGVELLEVQWRGSERRAGALHARLGVSATPHRWQAKGLSAGAILCRRWLPQGGVPSVKLRGNRLDGLPDLGWPPGCPVPYPEGYRLDPASAAEWPQC